MINILYIAVGEGGSDQALLTLIKAFLPETPVFVDSACAAGVTRERHEAALETMRSCQIVVK